MKNINEKNFPIAISLIDLLAAHPVVGANPELVSGFAALKDVVVEAWNVVDEAAG